MKYVALLRGVNVGGNSMLKMADLKDALIAEGFADVKTYINSGNIIFASNNSDTVALANQVQACIKKHFAMDVPTVVFSQRQLQTLVDNIPKGWGEAEQWKYNILFMLPPYDMDEVVANIGELKPDIETLVPADGYLYQSVSIKVFGRATTGKLAANVMYKRMTIRNWNTTQKVLALMKAA